MAEAKKQLIKINLEGIAKFPKVNGEPDTKFNPDGEYKTGIILAQEDAQPHIDKIEAAANEIFEATKKDLTASLKELKGEKLVKAKKALAELKLGDMPFKPVYDEEGNETGEVCFNFKMKAQRKDKKTGKVIKQRPKLFDASGKDITNTAIEIWGGSRLEVGGSLNPFYIPGTNTCGVGLRLGAVQIIELRSGGGGNAESYGFKKRDGYEASDEDTPSSSEDEGSTDDQDAGAEEF